MPLEDLDLLMGPRWPVGAAVANSSMCLISRSSRERTGGPEYALLLPNVVTAGSPTADFLLKAPSGRDPPADLKACRMRLPCTGGLLTVVGLTSASAKTSLGLKASDRETFMRCESRAYNVCKGSARCAALLAASLAASPELLGLLLLWPDDTPSAQAITPLAGPASSDTNDASERHRLGGLLGGDGSNAEAAGVSLASVSVVKRTLTFLNDLELGLDFEAGLAAFVLEVCESPLWILRSELSDT
eukprot:355383-Chlamydomonas_euryale.AAC.2